MTAQDIRYIQIEMFRNEAQVLFLQVAQDGRFERAGSKNLRTPTETLVKSSLEKPAVSRIFDRVPADFNELAGFYNDREAKGDKMGLSVLVQYSGGTATFQMIYGSSSTGPTKDLKSLVIAALNETEQQYTALA